MLMRTLSTRATASFFLAALFLLACATGVTAAVPSGQPQGQSIQIFSQGQAPVDPQDQAKSQQMAIQDFLAQGVSQAVTKFLSPAQMGVHFNDIQKKILNQPSKYIDSYQVFSQGHNESVFKVVGQVTVAMDVLLKDLEANGFPVSKGGAASPADASEAAEDGNRPENGSTGQAAGEEAAGEEEPAPVATRGLAATKKELLWVVPEKWEHEWLLPSEQERGSLFAGSVNQQLDNLNFELLLPPPASVRMDLSGNIPVSQVVSLAESLGVKDAVVGTVVYKRDRTNRQVYLEASLRVIRAGKTVGDLRKAQSVEELSNEEGALELASRVVPDVARLLGAEDGGANRPSGPPAQQREPAQQQGGTAEPGAVQGGPWTLSFPSAQYPYWKALERVLREQFKNMHISGLEMSSGEGVVRLANIDGSVISRMNGTTLPSGAVVKVDHFSVESRVIKISFSLPGKAQ
ncbi:MAG: hypothetical protein LLG06_09010 [Desulfobacteraceae bacterium]|nr:hypothetical protein [Desulfobacteraceae bacterium]